MEVLKNVGCMPFSIIAHMDRTEIVEYIRDNYVGLSVPFYRVVLEYENCGDLKMTLRGHVKVT